MRILIIHNKYKLEGGEDAVVNNESELLSRHGHTVHVLYFDNRDINSTVKKLKLSYQLIYNVEAATLVDQVIRDFRPNIVHVHNFFYVASPSVFFSAERFHIPVVVTLHNYRLICSGALLLRDSAPCELCVDQVFPVYGTVYGCHQGSSLATAQLTLATGIHKVRKTWLTKVARYITLTPFARQKFIHSSLHLPPEKIIVKANSVDDTPPVSAEVRDDYYLFIGRLSGEKGIEVLLSAFQGQTDRMVIIGDGPFRPAVENAAAGNQNIEYLGYQNKPVIVSMLQRCRALIVPSVCYENLPTTVLEAFSAATPVIISDLDNLRDIVTHQYNGIHFKTNDPDDLLKVVKQFSADHLQYHHMYKNARKTYLENYAHEINYRALIGIYETTIADFNRQTEKQ